MKPILLTGMSGTGKSSVIAELRKRSFNAIDMDEPGWSLIDLDGNQLLNEKKLQNVIDAAGNTPLFISGCAENQVKFYSQFSHIILLSAPFEILEQRLRTRSNNSYGKRKIELDEVLTYLETVEPLLRLGATCEIITTIPLDQVVEEVLTQISSSGQDT